TDYKYVLDGLKLDSLLEAFAKLLSRVEVSKTPIIAKEIAKDRFTVTDKMHQIQELISTTGKVSFFKLFDGDYTKSEIINTFLAILELLKNQTIKASQTNKFNDIIIEKGECYGQS
ncbi:MAG: segregation/condensation protein A, partial [Firmicutes bacterium]|nr:segregation/condensation protein A [Bacillota bacterium]